MYKLIQVFIPHKFITYIAGKIAYSKIKWLKNSFIKIFILLYKPNMEEAIFKNSEDYDSFNDFFTRKLNYSSREICLNQKNILSPVDGKISDAGLIKEGTLIQAKKFKYKAEELLLNSNVAKKAISFITLYLAPGDYHRIHAPLEGSIVRAQYIPGSLFSVNELAQKNIPSLYLRNERAWIEIKNKNFSYTLVFVGASIVSGIIPRWYNSVTVSHKEIIKAWKTGPSEKNRNIIQAQYLAHFSMGSTVIILLPKQLDKDKLKNMQGREARFGEVLFELD
tara:strand:- start:274 stop:1110 length:837 start_codon:yes stop_codon:yes gene_type:complete